MSSVLHMVWLGGSLPMGNMVNLHKLARMFAEELDTYSALPEQDQPYMPLLWLDASAYQATLSESAIPVQAASLADIPSALQTIANTALDTQAQHCKWLKISIHETICFVPVLLYEDTQQLLAQPWQDLSDVQQHWQTLWHNEDGRGFLEHLGCSNCLEEINGNDVATYLHQLITHTKIQWRPYGLLCMASDLLRMQVLMLFPGAYIDVGDVAEKLLCFPTRRRVHAQDSPFCGHQTAAIENDFFFCQSRSLMKAIALGAYLLSVYSFENLAVKLGSPRRSDESTPELLARLLPHIDTRMPVVPDLKLLFTPPFTKLASYIPVAYGASPLLEESASLQHFFQHKRMREVIINEYGGFTGYQKVAYHLAPKSRKVWEQCSDEFGLTGYAPQLGWQTYGFGVIDRLIHTARILLTEPVHQLRSYAVDELRRLARQFDVEPARFERIAIYCSQVFDLAKCAHFEPAKRDECVTEIRRLSLEV